MKNFLKHIFHEEKAIKNIQRASEWLLVDACHVSVVVCRFVSSLIPMYLHTSYVYTKLFHLLNNLLTFMILFVIYLI